MCINMEYNVEAQHGILLYGGIILELLSQDREISDNENANTKVIFA